MPDKRQKTLKERGHTVDGTRCALCWSRAQTLYANGQGPFDSLNDAYYEALSRMDELDGIKESDRGGAR